MSINSQNTQAPQHEQPAQEGTQDPKGSPRRLAALARWGKATFKVIGVLLTMERIATFLSEII
ncbi:hypothetical protein ACIPMU_37365 [Streptomyces cyaneofuscatus]|uniref:hypothetical protein n=1 Tax=Streptomyces cyaneofuscatus TaxID=66883 RepID=UPI0037F6CF51